MNLGENDLTKIGIPLTLLLEEIHTRKGKNKIFKITPMNFHMPMSDYNLIYTFQNSSGQPKLSMIFLAENNSVQMNWKYYDSDKTSCESTLGEGQVLTIYPEKIEFLKHLEPCRQEPYNELLLNRTLSLVQRRCTEPC